MKHVRGVPFEIEIVTDIPLSGAASCTA